MLEKVLIAVIFTIIGGAAGHYIGHNHQVHLDDEHMEEMMAGETKE